MYHKFYGKQKRRLNIWLTGLGLIVMNLLFITTGSYGININCYPDNAGSWTGSCTMATKTQTNLMQAYANGGQRAWAMFDISAIPPGSTINSVKIHFYIYAQSYPYYQWRKVTSDPVMSPASTVFTEIGSGTNYFTYTSSVTYGWRVHTLGSSINADVQAKLGTLGSGNLGWFALGLYEYENSNDWLWVYGAQDSYRPYLEIDYTTNFADDAGIDSIVSPLPPVCEGVHPIIVKLKNFGYNALTSCTIKWSLTGINQSDIPWTGNLASGASTYITLNPAYNFTTNLTLAVQTFKASDPNASNNLKTNIIQVLQKPSIFTQPTDQVTQIGGNATFSILGSGANISYQWQISTDGGSTWLNLINTGVYSNVYTQSMNITGATYAMSGYKYRCMVSSTTCSPSATSNGAMLVVGDPIRLFAGTSYGCAVNNVSVPITVTNMTNISSFKLSLNYPVANLTFISASNVNPVLSGGTWSASAAAGKVTLQWSAAAPVTITNGKICDITFSYGGLNNDLIWDSISPGNLYFNSSSGVNFPSDYYNGAVNNTNGNIITQPAPSVVVGINANAQFSVSSSGNPTYQWQVSTNGGTTFSNLSNNATYSGVNTSVLSITSCQLTMNNNKYRCIVYGCGASANTSQAGTLNVIRLVIIKADSLVKCLGDTIIVKVRVWNYDSVQSASLTLKYKVGTLQFINFQNYPGNLGFTAVNGAVPGTISFAAFNTNPVLLADGAVLFEVRFKYLTDSTKLQWDTWTIGNCQFTNLSGATLPTIWSNGVVYNGRPVITSHPASQTVYQPDPVSFSVTATGYNYQFYTYQWQQSSDGGTTWTNVPGNAQFVGVNSPNLYITSTNTSMNGYKYHCVVTGMCVPPASNAATLTVNPPPIRLNPGSGPSITATNGCAGDTLLVPLYVQNCNNIGSISLKLNFNAAQLTFAGYQNLNTALASYSLFYCTSSGSTVTFFWTKVLTNSGANVGDGILIKLKFVLGSTFTNSPLNWSAVSGDCQFTNSTGANLAMVSTNGTVNSYALPDVYSVITPQPANGHYCIGGPGVQIGLNGSQVGVNYALYRDNVALTGYNVSGTGASLAFGAFTTAGNYTVMAVNSVTGCSKMMSEFVYITIDNAPVVYNITGGGSYCDGGNGLSIGLSNSEPEMEYQLFLDGTAVGTPVAGTGSALDFGLQTTAGTYTIEAHRAFFLTCPTAMNPSGGVSIVVNPVLTPTISISQNPPGAFCPGTSITFTAVATNVGTTPVYQWKKNGVNIGTNTNTYTSTTLADLDVITCTLTSNAICASTTTVVSNSLTMSVSAAPTVGVSIAATPGATICAGTTVTFTATPSNGGTNPSYQWKKGLTMVGTNSPTYTYTPLAGDVITCVVTSNSTCATGNPATSNAITMTVNPVLPASVTVAPSPSGPVCAGTPVTYTATPVNGGASPTYQWKVNGITNGTNSNTFNYTPVAGDLITCTMTSSLSCPSGSPYTSTPITATVNPLMPVTVTVAANPTGSICAGTAVSFTATPNNGGTTPVYAWKKNGTAIGTNSATFTSSSLANGDIITCVLTSNITCPTGNPATSTPITMTVNPLMPVSVSILASPAGAICDGTSITYTATPVNGGTTPAYQWKKNGTNIGTGNTYTSSSMANGDLITCVLTSNETCATGSPATSNTITQVVNPLLPVSVNIAASPSGAICDGTSVTFTATPNNGGTAPSYQWKKNGTPVGTGTSYTTTTLANNDQIVCLLTSNATCATGSPATSNLITQTVNPLMPVSVNIAASPSGAICSGTSVTFTATPTNGGTTPVYQWKKNGVNIGTGGTTYSSSTLANNDVITCVLTSNETCATGTPATSNGITMTVNPLMPVSVNIGASPNGAICNGTSVTFTASPTNGGNAPAYQWKKNGVNVGTGSTYTSASLVNNDQIICVLTSNETCATGNPATSNTITQVVNPLMPVSVAVTPTPSGPICTGTSVTFNAVPTNGGTTPAYQWKKNGTNVGTSASYTTTTLANNDIITCVLTSNITCPTGNPYTSTPITMTVNPQPVVTISPVTVCLEGGPITLTGGSPAGGTYSGTPVSGGVFTPVTAGDFTVTYNYTQAPTCFGSASATYSVVSRRQISGNVKYDNTPQTPMANVKIKLTDASNAPLDSVLTASPDAYNFRCLLDGSYHLVASTTRPWIDGNGYSGVNALDALIVAQYTVGLQPGLSNFRKIAGDVNGINGLNSADAMLIMRRFVGTINSFAAGDWVFDIPAIINLSGVNVNIPIWALKVGDVSGDCIPSTSKHTMVNLETEGNVTNINPNEIEIPVYSRNALKTSAISLVINLPESISEILNVECKAKGMIWNQVEHQLRMAWYGLDPVEFKAGEKLLSIRIKTSQDAGDLITGFWLSNETMFNEGDLSEQTNVVLQIPTVKIMNNNTIASKQYYLGNNHPNPFDHKTAIDYVIPEDGNVRLSIFNLLGEELQVLVNGHQTAGTYEFTYDGTHLTPGVYLYKIQVSDQHGEFVKTRMMVVQE